MQNQRKGKSDCQSNLVPIFRSDVKVSTGHLEIKNIETPYEQFFTTLKFFVFFSSWFEKLQYFLYQVMHFSINLIRFRILEVSFSLAINVFLLTSFHILGLIKYLQEEVIKCSVETQGKHTFVFTSLRRFIE